MTSEEIDRLEAGRDADALVAELIPLAGVRMECVASEPGGRYPYWRYVEGGFREKFRPTTDAAAAALVLQWLRARPERQDELADATELAICKAALRAVAGELFPPQKIERSRGDEVASSMDHTQ